MPERPKALVVDDDEPIRTMLAKIVERLDINVETAKDGDDAIRHLDRNGYHVILLDLMMPHVDGYTVLRHITAHYPEKLKCTIIASAVPESEILRRFNHPVFRIHPKPFDMGRLMDDIAECAGMKV